MSVEPDRDAAGDPVLRWKIRLFSIAAGFGIAGIATGSDRLVAVAVAILLVGFLLRWFPRRG